MMEGIPSSPGIGCGRVFILHEREVPLGRSEPNASAVQSGQTPHVRRSEESEMERFYRGLEVAEKHYQGLIERVKEKIGEDEAEIFEGHLEILTSDDILDAVKDVVMSGGGVAERAVFDFTEMTAREFEELDSEYFRQRAGDIRDIGRRLAEAIYYGSITDPGDIPEESVVVAVELTPSATAHLDTDKVVAIVTEKGGRTSHAAILARSLSIPCVTGVEGLLARVYTRNVILVDGDTGKIETEVDERKIGEAKEKIKEQKTVEAKRREWSSATPARLSDGFAYQLHVNIGGVKEAENAMAFGIDGIGLFRSEFLFMRFSDYPTIEQQAEEYRNTCKTVSPHPVIIRLLDCGADKPLPYSDIKEEDNPFLGERGIRFLLAREKRLREQLAAIDRIRSEGHDIRVMIPMVISVEEIKAVKGSLPSSSSDLPIGIMVETPAAVMNIDSLASHSDFFSIGTNDLVQYLLTVDRGNSRVADYYQECHPAVIRAISMVCTAAKKANIEVGVCGDMASHIDTALALLALGINKISASVAAIPEIKAALSTVGKEDLDRLGKALREAPDADTAKREILDVLGTTVDFPWENALIP